MCLGFRKPAPSCKHIGTTIRFATYCLGSSSRQRDRNVGLFNLQLWRVPCKTCFFVRILNKCFSTFLPNVVNNFYVWWYFSRGKALKLTFSERTTRVILSSTYSAGHTRSYWACSCFLIGQSTLPASYPVPEPSCPSKSQCSSRRHENESEIGQDHEKASWLVGFPICSANWDKFHLFYWKEILFQ